MAEVKFRPGGLLAGQTFTLDDNFLKYKNAYGKYASVPRKSIQTVVIEPKSMYYDGKGDVQFGHS